MAESVRPEILLRPWAEDDLPLLHRANAPEMTEHLGGPETEEKVLVRHRRYLALGDPAAGRMFSVRLRQDGQAVGTIGFWERAWRGATVYETGWGILPEHQGRGFASLAAAAVIAEARRHGRHRHLHAFPSVDHPASNGVCRKAGFTLLGAHDFEYPPGRFMRCHDWCLDLTGPPAPA